MKPGYLYQGEGKARCVWFPVFEDAAELAHHAYCAGFFLPPKRSRATLYCTPEALGPEGTPGVPEYCVEELPPGIGQRVEIDYKAGADGLDEAVADADFVFLWDSRARESLGEVKGQVITVDRNHTQWECYNYPMFMDRFVDDGEREAMRRDSHARFLARIHELESDGPPRPGFIFGTGPSVMEAYSYDFSGGIRIVCNTIIKNDRLMDHIRPHFLVAADAIYHYGVSRYARQFQDDAYRFLKETDCMLVMQEVLACNVLRLYPEVAGKILSVPYRYDDQPTVHLRERWELAPFHNVLNQFLLPLASSVSDTVALLGFDGRKKTDKHFWSTDESINYESLKPLHQQAHPGFFAQTEYALYAEEMAETSDRIMRYGEGFGKRYVSLNESSNFALQQRRGSFDEL